MNIGSINTGMMPMRSMQQNSQQQTLSDEQKATVNDILSNYDAESMTQQDFEEISQQFGEAGIAPSESLKTTIEEAGYDFSEFLAAREANGPMQGGMPPPPPRDGENTAESEYSSELSELLTALENNEADEADFESFISFMRSGNDDMIGNLLDTRG